MDNKDILKERIISINKDDPMVNSIGLEILELEYNRAVSRMKLSHNIINSYGIAHGGALMTMADTTAGYAACMSGYFVATISGTLNFLSPGKDTEYIYCECTQLKAGSLISVYEIRIKDDKGKLLDSGEYSYYISRDSVLENR